MQEHVQGGYWRVHRVIGGLQGWQYVKAYALCTSIVQSIAALQEVAPKPCLQCAVSCADALRCMHKAIGFYTDLGRLGMAARNLRVRPTAQCLKASKHRMSLKFQALVS